MMWTLICVLYFFLYLVRVSPKMRKAIRLEKKGELAARDALVQTEIDKWARRLLKKTHVTVEVTGKENIPDEPVVFVSNHQGYFDIPVLFTALDPPNPLLAKQEMCKVPLLRTWMKLLGCVFLDRDNARQSMQALREAEKVVESGKSITIFPEGTRAQSGTLGEFKAGAFRVATKSRAKLVPVLIDGSYRALEGNHYRVKATGVKVTILPPIPTEGLSREEIRALPQKVEAIMRRQQDAVMDRAAK